VEVATKAPSLLAIFWRFLRFGFLAWSGPVAQIAMIKRELVEEERWIEPSRFNRLLAIDQVLPGPEREHLRLPLTVEEFLKNRELTRPLIPEGAQQLMMTRLMAENATLDLFQFNAHGFQLCSVYPRTMHQQIDLNHQMVALLEQRFQSQVSWRRISHAMLPQVVGRCARPAPLFARLDVDQLAPPALHTGEQALRGSPPHPRSRMPRPICARLLRARDNKRRHAVAWIAS
jgi:hypothetical protein